MKNSTGKTHINAEIIEIEEIDPLHLEGVINHSLFLVFSGFYRSACVSAVSV